MRWAAVAAFTLIAACSFAQEPSAPPESSSTAQAESKPPETKNFAKDEDQIVNDSRWHLHFRNHLLWDRLQLLFFAVLWPVWLLSLLRILFRYVVGSVLGLPLPHWIFQLQRRQRRSPAGRTKTVGCLSGQCLRRESRKAKKHLAEARRLRPLRLQSRPRILSSAHLRIEREVAEDRSKTRGENSIATNRGEAMRTLSAFAAVCASTLAMASSIGTVPRSTATQYPAHTVSDQVAIGAVKLNEQAVRKIFSSDLNRCCIVVELAIFPTKDHPAKISLGDFSLRIANTDTAVRPSGAKVVASSLQRKAGSDHDVTVSPQFGVGYESGTYNDPNNNGPYNNGRQSTFEWRLHLGWSWCRNRQQPIRVDAGRPCHHGNGTQRKRIAGGNRHRARCWASVLPDIEKEKCKIPNRIHNGRPKDDRGPARINTFDGGFLREPAQCIRRRKKWPRRTLRFTKSHNKSCCGVIPFSDSWIQKVHLSSAKISPHARISSECRTDWPAVSAAGEVGRRRHGSGLPGGRLPAAALSP